MKVFVSYEFQRLNGKDGCGDAFFHIRGLSEEVIEEIRREIIALNKIPTKEVVILNIIKLDE